MPLSDRYDFPPKQRRDFSLDLTYDGAGRVGYTAPGVIVEATVPM